MWVLFNDKSNRSTSLLYYPSMSLYIKKKKTFWNDTLSRWTKVWFNLNLMQWMNCIDNWISIFHLEIMRAWISMACCWFHVLIQLHAAWLACSNGVLLLFIVIRVTIALGITNVFLLMLSSFRTINCNKRNLKET